MSDIFVAPVDTCENGRPVSSTDRFTARDMRDGPPPFPYGWFAVAFCHELQPGTMLTRRFMDREIVVYRTASGTARAIEAYCPHLGAHLGRGGTVEGEELRCPFHGFRFEVSGKCTYTPYGTPPPAARLGVLELREICGVVLVWHGPPGATPWEIKPPDEEPGWRPVRGKTMRMRSHPQEVSENSVDAGHFGVLHGFGDIRTIGRFTTDGPRLSASYSFRKPLPFYGGMRSEFRVSAQGLGFSLVDVRIAAGWEMRELVLPTPIGEREVDVRIGTILRSRGTGRLSRTAWMPVDAIIERLTLRILRTELLRDQQIWEHKKYLGRPAIAEGDGPIGGYRAWARQFYSTAPSGA